MTNDRVQEQPRTDEAPDQTWGQGEGEHEPTIPEDAVSSTTPIPPSSSEGIASDPQAPSLAREDEGMDR